MTKLTEDMIIARTKSSELGAVKKLNCWGSDLEDVSLVRRLSNVEVLSLSLNKIGTLADFNHCRNLVELYIRRNAIRDLSELCYLQDLPRLRRLLLVENPCVETAGPHYRATVLRCLPNLEMLDNTEVTPEEVELAMRTGLILQHPLTRQERGSPELTYFHEASPPVPVPPPGRRSSTSADYKEVFMKSSALSRSPPSDYYVPSQYIQQPEARDRRSPEESTKPVTNGAGNTNNALTHGRNSASVTSYPSSGEEGRDGSPPRPQGSTSPGSLNINPGTNDGESEARKVQRSPVQEYYPSPTIDREEMVNGYQNHSEYSQDGRAYKQEGYYDDSQPLQHRNSGFQVQPQLQRQPLTARLKSRTKSSNLLSAVLCLIPELDAASLEVVELAIHRRMDEIGSD